MQRNVLVADADPDRRLSMIDAIRDGVTTVTAIGRIAANADEAGIAAYDAIVLGFGRSAKENAQMLDGTRRSSSAMPLRGCCSLRRSSDALEQALALNPAFASVPRAENFGAARAADVGRAARRRARTATRPRQPASATTTPIWPAPRC